MANQKQNIQMKFWVTEEEKNLIDQKMKLLPTKQYGAYLRKMAIDGYIIYTDTTDIKEMSQILGAISRNVNQIAKRINGSGAVDQEDMEEIKDWMRFQSHILIGEFSAVDGIGQNSADCLGNPFAAEFGPLGEIVAFLLGHGAEHGQNKFAVSQGSMLALRNSVLMSMAFSLRMLCRKSTVFRANREISLATTI